MNYRHSTLLYCIAILIGFLVLAGCSSNDKELNASLNEDTIVEQPINDPTQDILPTLTHLAFQPDRLVLAPQYKYKVSLMATLSDATTRDILSDSVPGHADEHELKLVSSNPDQVSIDERGIVTIDEQATVGQTVTLNVYYGHLSAALDVMISYSLDDTVIPSDTGIDVVTNPESIAVVVNKARSLPDGYEPDDLVKPNVPFSFSGENERNYLRQEAAEALERLFEQAEEDGISITAVSGYRTFQTQRSLFNHYVRIDGEEKARQYSAYPGTSEHQTGLTMDISSPSINNIISTEAGFGDTEEGKWLAENVAKHGFIIRYPEGKEHITGYVYEPWHIRYVGVPLAQYLTEHRLTMEEYFADVVPVSQNIESLSIE